MTTVDHVARVEKRLRRYLQKSGRGRQGYLYHATCGPHYPLTREQFATLCARLAEEGLLEILSGSKPDTQWLVRKDFVEQTIADGVLQ